MRRLIRIGLCALLCGLMINAYVFSSDLINPVEVLVYDSFGYLDLEIGVLFSQAIILMPLLLFQILDGSSLYQYFCTASIYYFSRCPYRRKWCAGQLVKQFMVCTLFSLIYYGWIVFLCALLGRCRLSQEFIILYIYQSFILALWLYITCTLINILAIRLGSYKGFTIVVIAELLSFMLLSLGGEGKSLSIGAECIKREEHFSMLKLNPMAHLILGWHTSDNAGINDVLNYHNLEFPFSQSIIYYLALALVITFSAIIVINRTDIISNREG